MRRPALNLERLRAHIDEFGIAAVSLASGRRAVRHARHRARAVLGRPARTFSYRGHPLTEFHHPSGRTWLTERAVEIPVARAFLASLPPGARVMEVGNVLGRYGTSGHLVVDRYERAPGVVNADAVDYRPDVPPDAILAISTLEHVGWDEPVRDVGKAERTLRHLQGLLAPGGRMLVTIPLGYHPALDVLALGGQSGAVHTEVVRRRRDGAWETVSDAALTRPRYEWDARTATAVWVAEFDAAG